jgi:thiosulfate dehydrogenase [quinone] large subunit
MTRNRMYLLTAASAALYVLLAWVFADGLFTATFLDTHAYASSSALTWLLLATIVVAGIVQARRLPAAAVSVRPVETTGEIADPVLWRRLIGAPAYALAWLPVRFFVGQEWLAAGEHKVRDDAWMSGGSALQGYWERAVAIPEGGKPAITYGWFRDVLQYLLDHETYTWFAKVVAVGEVLVGLGLIVGALVGIAAFFGTLMNFNFQLAGSASTNPVLFGLGVFLVIAWKTAGYVGLDRVLLPMLKTPWGRVESHRHPAPGADRPLARGSYAD